MGEWGKECPLLPRPPPTPTPLTLTLTLTVTFTLTLNLTFTLTVTVTLTVALTLTPTLTLTLAFRSPTPARTCNEAKVRCSSHSTNPCRPSRAGGRARSATGSGGWREDASWDRS